MAADGSTIVLSDPDGRVSQHYPDLRAVKKAERNNILKQGFIQLKTQLRSFLQDMAVNSFEFEVNGNILDTRLYSTGINEVLSKLTQDKATMLYQSEEIFKNAQYLYSTPDYEGNPDIYRWNYFYTPVKVGEDTFGVRIAVRDMVRANESHIYNWDIKTRGPVAGGKPGVSAELTDSSLGTLVYNSIPQSVGNFKSDSAPVNPILQALESKKAEQQAKRDALARAFVETGVQKQAIDKPPDGLYNGSIWNFITDSSSKDAEKTFKFSEMTSDETLKIAQEYRKKAPIEIPESATIKPASKVGYEQISYNWRDATYKYQVRWHTRTPGAPANQGNTWVVERITPGSGGIRPKSEILSGAHWISRFEWQEAIEAYQNGTATQHQLQILEQGHWKE